MTTLPHSLVYLVSRNKLYASGFDWHNDEIIFKKYNNRAYVLQTESVLSLEVLPYNVRCYKVRVVPRHPRHRPWICAWHLQHMKSRTHPDSTEGDSHTSRRREYSSLAQRSCRALGTWCYVGMSVESTVLMEGSSSGVGKAVSGCGVPEWSAALASVVVAGHPRAIG